VAWPQCCFRRSAVWSVVLMWYWPSSQEIPAHLVNWPRRLQLPNSNRGSLLSLSVAFFLAVAWLSGNSLVSINVVTLRRARLVLGWVTVCRRLNHLGM